MSGPKVVKVITREELVAAGDSLLRRLDAALEAWEQACIAVGASSADQSASKERRNALEQMLRADRFAEFGQAAVAEIDFLDADAGRRRDKAAANRAQERARLHSGMEIAKVLLRQTAPATAERLELQRAASGELGLDDLDAVLARVQKALFQPTAPQLGANQQVLASRLAQAEKSEDFEAWRRKLAVSSPALETFFRYISELELHGYGARALELHHELLAAVAIPDDAVREMRIDSFAISLKKAKEEAIALEKLRRKAAILGTELARFRGGMESLQTLHVAAQGAISELQTAITTGEQRLTKLQAAQVADARRQAVLDGLQQLGYEVHKDLSTATSEGGRLVLRNPASSDYGVEIAASPGMERLQVRAVTFESNRDTAGDIPAEQRWCDDFEALKSVLQSRGTEVTVERAMGVGAVPLKLLSNSTTDDTRRVSNFPHQVLKK